jgi:hypothetical protein
MARRPRGPKTTDIVESTLGPTTSPEPAPKLIIRAARVFAVKAGVAFATLFVQ